MKEVTYNSSLLKDSWNANETVKPNNFNELSGAVKNVIANANDLAHNYLQQGKQYVAGDIVYSKNLNKGCYLVCTQGGATGDSEPQLINKNVGETVTDGAVTWTVRANISSVNGVVASKDGEVQVKSLLSTRITTVVDLNDFKKAGVYYCPESELAVQCLNMPINLYAFYLEIITMGSNFIKQVFTTYKPSKAIVYVRNYYVNEGGWGKWQEILLDNTKSLVSTEIPKNADLNNYKEAGMYHCKSSETAMTIVNSPVTKWAFYLDIEVMASNIMRQILISNLQSNPSIHIRTYYNGDWGGWKEVAYKNDISVIPVGIIMPFAGNGSIPDGWVICNGAAVSRSTYAALFSAIGTTYGTGNDSTTFNLPNLMNRFIEGSNTAGTVLAAGLPNITGHFSTALEWSQARFDGAFRRDNQAGNGPEGSAWSNSQLISFDASRSSAIYGASTTVQPPAMTAIYCIKY